MDSIRLTQLHNKIGEVEFLANELRNEESAATQRNEPGAVGRELSYAIVKLREARMWVKEAREIWEGEQPGM